MSLFDDLLENETISSVRARVVAAAQAAELAITSWVVGDPGEQMLATAALLLYAASLSISQTVRGFASLDTSVDPGDDDPYDPGNADLPAEAGFLSAYGQNTYGTTRGEETFATGFVTFTNDGIVARTFGPEALTFTWTDAPPSPAPTYRNVADDSIYTNPDGTVTVAAGDELVLPIRAEEIGTRSNAPPEALSLTTVLGGCSATNEAAIIGTDRESAADYRARCRQAPARLSLSGPSAAYEYLAKTQLDGEPLLNASGNAVNITRVQVSQESDTGVVEAFYASPSGPATSEDVDAANANIEADSFAVPDAITFTGAAAVQVTIAIAGTAKVKAGPGVTAAAAKAGIVAAIVEYFKTVPVGGVDQIAGAGVVYKVDYQAAAKSGYPGLYDVLVVTPGGASTSLAKGRVAVPSTSASDWTVTVV